MFARLKHIADSKKSPSPQGEGEYSCQLGGFIECKRMKFGTRKMLTFGGQRVILMLLHNFIYLRIRYTLVKTYALVVIFSNTENELCSSKIGAAFFVRGFGCAFFMEV